MAVPLADPPWNIPRARAPGVAPNGSRRKTYRDTRAPWCLGQGDQGCEWRESGPWVETTARPGHGPFPSNHAVPSGSGRGFAAKSRVACVEDPK